MLSCNQYTHAHPHANMSFVKGDIQESIGDATAEEIWPRQFLAIKLLTYFTLEYSLENTGKTGVNPNATASVEFI